MGSVTARELTAPATLEWRPVLCETNMNDSTVTRVQRALKSAGFDPGPIDGKAGGKTMDALNAYQRSKGLPEDRYLNLQTLQSLGVSSYS
jgi:peptidoglycan hydrolase-like protein with peptidoglycan-binding domain